MSSPEELAALLAAPALPPPDGVTPNFDNPPNQNALAWVVTTLCMVVSTLCVCLRVFTRIWVVKKFGFVEILMFLAYGAYWGTAYAGYALIDTPGYYVHTWELHNKDMVRPLWLILVYGCAYSATLPLIKTAILVDWCRLFISIDRYKSFFWWGCTCIIIFQCVWGALCIILLNMQCRPHEAIWKFWLPSKCYSLPKVMLTSATVQVVSDVAMFLLPQRLIWSLQMSLQRKFGVSVIFSVGIVAVLSACFRLAHTIDFAKEPDSMYLIGPLLFWACAEMTCGFFILSMPSLSKLVIGLELPRRIKTAFGYSQTSSVRPSKKGPGAGSRSDRSNSRPKKTSWRAHETTWTRVDEGDIALGPTGPSESQTNLRGGELGRSDSKSSVQATQTVDVFVSDSRSGGDRRCPDGWI